MVRKGQTLVHCFEKVLQHVNEKAVKQGGYPDAIRDLSGVRNGWVNDSALPFIGRTWFPMSTPSCILSHGV